MLSKKVLVAGFAGALSLFTAAAQAQDVTEEGRHEFSVQGTGFFTKDTSGNGITQHSTDTGGFLAGYRFHFNNWLGAEANYGYARNTLQSFTLGGPLNVQANVHQATGALVVTLPWSISRIRPYVLAGTGALIFDPTGNPGGFVAGAGSQTKATFLYGGGIDARIVKHVFARVEYRGFVYGRPDFGIAGLHTGSTAHTAQPSAGIGFRF